MKRLGAFVAVLLAACSGAAAERWAKPGASAADVERDAEICRHQAASAVSARGRPRGPGDALREKEIADICLKNKGYQRR